MLKILDTDAALGHARETELAHRFIRYDSDGIRQIQAARLFDHRYAEAAFRIGFQEVFRKAFRFLPEYEHIIVLELDIGITLFRFRRQIKKDNRIPSGMISSAEIRISTAILLPTRSRTALHTSKGKRQRFSGVPP